MTAENEATGILRGKGGSKIILKHPYGLVHMVRHYHFALLTRVTHWWYLTLSISHPPTVARHQDNTLTVRNHPAIKNRGVCVPVYTLTGRKGWLLSGWVQEVYGGDTRVTGRHPMKPNDVQWCPALPHQVYSWSLVVILVWSERNRKVGWVIQNIQM